MPQQKQNKLYHYSVVVTVLNLAGRTRNNMFWRAGQLNPMIRDWTNQETITISDLIGICQVNYVTNKSAIIQPCEHVSYLFWGGQVEICFFFFFFSNVDLNPKTGGYFLGTTPVHPWWWPCNPQQTFHQECCLGSVWWLKGGETLPFSHQPYGCWKINFDDSFHAIEIWQVWYLMILEDISYSVWWFASLVSLPATVILFGGFCRKTSPLSPLFSPSCIPRTWPSPCPALAPRPLPSPTQLMDGYLVDKTCHPQLKLLWSTNRVTLVNKQSYFGQTSAYTCCFDSVCDSFRTVQALFCPDRWWHLQRTFLSSHRLHSSYSPHRGNTPTCQQQQNIFMLLFFWPFCYHPKNKFHVIFLCQHHQHHQHHHVISTSTSPTGTSLPSAVSPCSYPAPPPLHLSPHRAWPCWRPDPRPRPSRRSRQSPASWVERAFETTNGPVVDLVWLSIGWVLYEISMWVNLYFKIF